MSDVGREAFVRNLRHLRESRQGRALRCVATFACPSGTCPVTTAKFWFAEAPGAKPAQPPMLCSRCRAELIYRGIEAGGD
jgi:hypothetical protein